MDSTLILVTGGCRSGKSSFALRFVEERAEERVFIATSPVFDAETAERVRRHQEERRGRGWLTLEEEIDIARALASCPAGAGVLLDCLTLWIGNLMFRDEEEDRMPDEDEVEELAARLAAAARNRSGLTVVVTNEVGLGIVPDNPSARRFRDLAGRVSQTIAAAAAEVHFLVSGLPMRIK